MPGGATEGVAGWPIRPTPLKPRASLATAAADDSLDSRLDAPRRAQMAEAVRRGHCGPLPQSQEP